MDDELTAEETRLLEQDDRAVDQVPVWLVFIVGPWVASLGVLLWQSFHWLRTGAWPEASLRALGFEHLSTSWVGLQDLIYEAMEIHLSAWLIPISLVATFLFTRNDNEPIPEALKSARAKRANRSSGNH